jgi:hypothetical protein
MRAEAVVSPDDYFAFVLGASQLADPLRAGNPRIVKKFKKIVLGKRSGRIRACDGQSDDASSGVAPEMAGPPGVPDRGSQKLASERARCYEASV